MTLAEALYRALTGEAMASEAPLEEALTEHGWDASRLTRHAAECRAAGRPWPHPVPRELRGGIGAAQFQGALHQALVRHGLIGSPVPPSPARPLTQDERRLIADVPPHHGV